MLELLLLAGGMAMTGLGMATGMKGARATAEASMDAAQYESSVYLEEAAQRRLMSIEEQGIMREQLRRKLKEDRAKYAKAGVRMVGSPFQAQLRVVEDMSYDIGMLAHIRETEAKRLEQRATLSRMRGGVAAKVGKLEMEQTLYGGIGQMSMMGLSYALNR